ncbi:MAG TPA: hypothetical protein HA257_01990 [Candidatus Methanoperedenaceae archaeon]|nr:hypothetical protein [Candidatus Methanoperedenaceae archaeon]
MVKIDMKKEFRNLYTAPAKEAVIVDVPEMNFVMIDGAGDPNTSVHFQHAAEALYGISYTLKFMVKKGRKGIDYMVMPLEGLWYADDMAAFREGNKDQWKWTLMIMQPEYVTEDLLAEALAQVGKKKDLPALAGARFERLHEGLSAQVMHIGPYSAEATTIEKLHAFIQEKGYEIGGKHHEIYLSDPRRSAPEKIKTIIRQPIK